MRLTAIIIVMVTILAHSIVFGESVDKSYNELSGELSGTIIPGVPYLVVGDIYVTPGSVLTIEAGTILLFSGFTGLHVQGTLFANGTSLNPIVFTSIFDTCCSSNLATSPAPFDWNGIDVYENAIGTKFDNCVIKYSVYGIRAQTEHIKISATVFDDNGKSHFTIKDKTKKVESGVLFSYGLSAEVPPFLFLPKATDVTTSGNIAIPGGEENGQSPKTKVGAQVLRYAGLIIGVGCGVYSVIYYSTYYKPAWEKLNDLSDLDDLEKQTKSSMDWNLAKGDYDTAVGYTAAGAGGALLGLLAFSISFAF